MRDDYNHLKTWPNSPSCIAIKKALTEVLQSVDNFDCALQKLSGTKEDVRQTIA